ncbi:MAG: signal recognition particle protein [Candidatus Neomarinimicrobiota bacterium]
MFSQLADKFDSLFRNLRGLGKITDENIQHTVRDIRRALLEADVNFKVARDFVDKVKERSEGTKVIKSVKPGELFIKIIRDELITLLGEKPVQLELGKSKPAVILLAGLQGSGKTTTAAKLGNRLKKTGKSVMLVAADVYRPAAIKQLQILGKQIGIPVYAENSKKPVDICKNAVKKAKSDKTDIVILDSAGRLHIDKEMMTEIKEISDLTRPIETLFVVDSMTGQDAVNSASAFSKILDITGTILTKLDGDARGGAAISITEVIGKPIKFVGVSEKIDGLEQFEPQRIIDRLLGFGDVVSLVEKAESVMDEKEAAKLEKKFRKNEFDLEDFKNQLKQLGKMGPMEQVLGMMPGMNRKALKGLKIDDKQLTWTEAIINSMTAWERQNPLSINGSRRKRIALGSGRSVQQVNQLLKQFTQMKKMMKNMGKMKLPGLSKLPGDSINLMENI